MERCPCGNKKSYSSCCGRFLDGSAQAKTPEQLMRSRYTAYALGGFGNYLIQTWFPATAQGLSAFALSQKSLNWVGLEIHERSQQGDKGTVEFSARYTDDNGKEAVMRERSEFQRVQGRWLYVGGVVSTRD
jgi:SEC-C motif domain protein